jgi:hypothetical protein
MSRSVRAVLNESNPSLVAMAEQVLPLGDAMALIPRTIFSAVTSNVIVLPNIAKARAVLKCFVRAGTLTGYLTPISSEATPTTGQVGVSQTGDIEFASADAVTSAEVTYEPIEGDVVVETISVVAGTGVGTLLASKNALLLISATVLTGTTLGAKIVDDRAASAPATGHAKLNLLGQATFAVADAVTQASVTYIATPGIGAADPSVGTQLDSQVEF